MTPEMIEEKTQYREDFSALMKKLLWEERKPGTPTLKEIAIELGWGYDCVEKKVTGQRGLMDQDLPRWYRAIGKPIEFLRFIVRSCDPHADVIRLDRSLEQAEMSDEILSINVKLGELVETIQESVADGVITLDENKHIRDHCVNLVSDVFQIIQTSEAKEKRND